MVNLFHPKSIWPFHVCSVIVCQIFWFYFRFWYLSLIAFRILEFFFERALSPLTSRSPIKLSQAPSVLLASGFGFLGPFNFRWPVVPLSRFGVLHF